MDAMQYVNLNEEARSQVNKVQEYANDLNVDVSFDTNLKTDGVYDKGKIILNPNSKKAPLTTMVHEFTHGAESTEFYQPLKNLILKDEKNLDSKLLSIKELYNEHNILLDDDEALREYVAINTQEKLGSEEFVERLVKYNNSLANRIYEWVKHAVKKTGTQQDIEYNFLKAFKNIGENINDKAQYYIGKSEDGIEVAVIGNAISRKEAKDLKKVKKYLEENIGKTFNINEDGQVVNYRDYDVYEYLYSKYSQGLSKSGYQKLITKNRIVSDLGDVISVGRNPRFKANKNNKIHQSNPDIGKNGFSHYDSTFAIPIKDSNGTVSDYKMFEGQLIIEHNKDGKASLYDIVNIKRSNRALDITSIQSANNNAQLSVNNARTTASVNNISKANKSVKNSIGISLEDLKNKQLEIILKENPVYDEYHTWIRDVDDIKTFEETLNDSDWEGWEESGFDPSYNAEDVYDALEKGTITVYSSYPIGQGTFVTPSKMEAESYSGNGKVYEKEVSLNDVAWIDPTQGMYAQVNNELQYSVGITNNSIIEKINELVKEQENDIEDIFTVEDFSNLFDNKSDERELKKFERNQKMMIETASDFIYLW